ncbi:P-loop containing nucleoside triphosphate hydrolase protein [Chaetomium tenue]|uniref:P-loop containing nucleoside triphosphate hydrolase protein n=1 Tax=Chaetomium tenue TaxID=1854479 RepID=A0ACB7P568_9PEZI|nr:P-loop containing nucleoside triphosphate hydrolase protein [Chaetomium globosum]
MAHHERKSRHFTILLMGVTGSGKSTFASLASGQNLQIGHGLDPCTKRPQAVCFQLGSRPITLIDTPGFDDDTVSDVEILGNVSRWMFGEGMMGPMHNQSLDALILVHPVTRGFSSGMEKRRTRLLETLLGKNTYKRVTIVTTMWDSLETSHASRMASQFSLKAIKKRDKTGRWTDLCKDGARLERHGNTKDSTHRIIHQTIKRQGDTAKPNLFSFGAKFWKQLLDDLENDIDDFQQEIIDHRVERRIHSEKWKEWVAEKEEVEKQAKVFESQLRKTKALLFLARGLGKFWMAKKILKTFEAIDREESNLGRA